MGRYIPHGSTDQSVFVRILTTTGLAKTDVTAATGNVAMLYVREGGNATSAGTVGNLASGDAAHSDAGLVHLTAGLYRADPPDAAFATGADEVAITVTGDDLVCVPAIHPLGPVPADVTQWAGCTTFEQGGFPAVVLADSSAHGGSAASLEMDQITINSGTVLGNLTTSLFSTIAGNAANLVNLTLGNVAHGGAAATLTLASASVSGNIAAGNLALSGTLSAATNGLPWNAAWDAEVQSEAADALTAYGASTFDAGNDTVTPGNGTITAAVIAANAIDADALAADAVTEIQSGLSTFDAANDTVASVTAVGCVTGGINTGAGTITTLDALDTAQDTQHGTTRTQLTDMSGATFDSATDSLEALRNRGDSDWTTGAGGTPPDLMQSTTIATLASQTSFTLTAGSADDDAYNGALIVVTDQSTATQKAKGTVSDYVGSTRTVTLSSDPGIFTMATGDSVAIIAVGEAVASVDEAAIAAAVLAGNLSTETGAGTLSKALQDIETDATTLLVRVPGNLTVSGGRVAADATALSGNATAADNLESFALGNSLGTLPKVDVQQINGGATAADDLRTAIEAGLALESTAQSILADTAEIGAAGAGLTEAGGTGDHLTALSTLDAAAVRTALGMAAADLDDQLDALPTAAENATALLAAGDADGLSVEEAIKVLLASAAGKLSGAATTTITIRAVDDSKARITATVDADGNRAAVTLDATG